MWSLASLGRRRAFVVFLFVVASLMLLSTVPYWALRNMEVLRRQSDDVIEPARDLVARLELAFARKSATDAQQLLAQLDESALHFGPVEREHIARIKLFAARGEVESAMAASSRLHQELRATALASRADILDAQRRGLAWSVALFMLTLAAMLAVGWMAWHQRLLLEHVIWAHAQAEKGARDEEALRAAAAAVAAPLTTTEVVQQIASGAIQAAGADGAYAARLEPDGTMHVMTVAGKCGVAVDGTLNYSGTVIEQVVRTGAATVVQDPNVSPRAGKAVVVPMIEADGPIGVLALLYDHDLDQSTLPLLLARANTFGDLAAVALRKARLLEQSEERYLRLETVEQSRARLLRGFSHDIKNPLSDADAFLQLLQMGLRGPLAPGQLESLQRARASLGTGLRLLRDLLDFALASVGHIPLNILPTRINDVLRDVVEDHRAGAETKGIALTLSQKQAIPDVQTDIDRVRQVLDNLLSNAVKYTDEGGTIFVISDVVDTDLDDRPGRWIRIAVSDTGIGISPEHQEGVFTEFTRLSSIDEPGTGIGLAISQWLANALGGRITLVSKIGSGSTFTFWLPFLPTNEVKIQTEI